MTSPPSSSDRMSPDYNNRCACADLVTWFGISGRPETVVTLTVYCCPWFDLRI